MPCIRYEISSLALKGQKHVKFWSKLFEGKRNRKKEKIKEKRMKPGCS
jgi:hypothetical protein